MASEYTTVLDTGSGSLPALPLILMLATPVLMLACLYVAKARNWHVSHPIKISLWAAYASYVPMVMFQYWSVWDAQQTARNATAMSVEAGRLDWSTVGQAPDGISSTPISASRSTAWNSSTPTVPCGSPISWCRRLTWSRCRCSSAPRCASPISARARTGGS